MTIWLDAQLSPVLANWIRTRYQVRCFALRDIGPGSMHDEHVFLRAKREADVVFSKDKDFVALLERLGPPPQVVLVTIGNTSNTHMKEVLSERWPDLMRMLNAGEPLVELAG